METSDIGRRFLECAAQFETVASSPHKRPLHLAGEIDRVALIAARALNDAADLGRLPAYAKLRAGLLRLMPLGIRVISFFERPSCADWYRGKMPRNPTEKQQEHEDAQLLGLWTAATGKSWLMRDFPQEFVAGDAGLDGTHKYPQPGAKRVITVRKAATGERIDAPPELRDLIRGWPKDQPRELLQELAQHGYDQFGWRLPEEAIRCVETEEYDDEDWIARHRVRASHYARACRLLARLARNGGAETGGSGEQLRFMDAVNLLIKDLPRLSLGASKTRVSRAAGASNGFRTNGKRRMAMRIDRVSFDAWRLLQRDQDMDKEEAA